MPEIRVGGRGIQWWSYGVTQCDNDILSVDNFRVPAYWPVAVPILSDFQLPKPIWAGSEAFKLVSTKSTV